MENEWERKNGERTEKKGKKEKVEEKTVKKKSEQECKE